MRVKTGRAVSKILGIWVFFLLLILKGAFPKAAFALSTNACARDIRCVQLLKESFTPAVAAPIARRNDEIGIIVIPTGTFIPLYRWSQGTTVRAQLQARQKYCTTYPSDSVCVPFTGGQGNCVDYKVYYRIDYTYTSWGRTSPYYYEGGPAILNGPIRGIRMKYPSNPPPQPGANGKLLSKRRADWQCFDHT